MNMHKLLGPIRRVALLQCPKFSYNQANTYIPIRPLKEGDNVLFEAGIPKGSLPLMARGLAYLPFICFGLQGITSEWTALIIGGTIVSFFYALRLTLFANFMRSHEICRLTLNKNMTKFELKVPNTGFSREWEKAVWQANKVDPYEYLHKQYKEGKLDMKPLDMKYLKHIENKSENKGTYINENVIKYRRTLTIQLSKKQIVSFERRSMNEITDIIVNSKKKSLGMAKAVNMLQNYTIDKEKQEYLLIKTHKIGEEPLLFYLDLKKNTINTYDEYINAFAEGKTIVNIV